jgi:glycosyltransferase involved in cell wall biosynthesis
VTSEVYNLYEGLLSEAEQKAGTAAKINIPTDYLHHPSGLMRPQFRRVYADRKVPYPYPPTMTLPPLPGPRNDSRFLEDAAACLEGAYKSSIQRVHVLYTPPAGGDAKAVLEQLSKQHFNGRVDVSVFTPDGKGSLPKGLSLPGGGLAEQAKCAVTDEEGHKRLVRAAAHSDLVLFLTGEVVLDNLVLARMQRMANVTDMLVQPLVELPSGDQMRTPFAVSGLTKLFGGRYPSRDVKGLNFAVTGALLRRVGMLDRRLSSTYVAARELAYRMFNVGAYFSAVAVRKVDKYHDEKKYKDDQKLYIELCPNHWDRKEDGTFLTPKVSVYIPTYNASKYIERAVDSILSQDVQDLDVCLANDGSKDHTLQLLEDTYSDEPRVRWVDNPNGGIGWASNQAIRMSNSIYIGQLDSDDCLKPGAVRRLMEYLDDHPEVACCYGSCERVDAAGNYVKDEYSWPVFSREKMMITSIAHHFRMFRRQAWERTSYFREDIVNAVDYDIFLKMSEVGDFHHIDEMMYQRRWHGENTSNVNEGFQTTNTYRVQNETLERLGMLPFWEIYLPNPDDDRRVSYKLRDDADVVMFWPDYSRANPYQHLLYGKLRQEAEVVAGNIDAALKVLETMADKSKLTFHLHWLNFLLRDITDAAVAKKTAEDYIEKLKKFVWKGGRLVWTIHNHVSHDTPFHDLEVWMSNEIAKAAHVLHFHSEASIDEVAEVFDVPREKVKISRHGSYVGVYPDFVTREQAREQLGIAQDDEVILFSGQVRPYKGVETLVKAFRKLLKERPKLRLLIVGEMRFDLFAEIKPKLTKAEQARITATERFVDDMELQLFLRASDFAVYPYQKILTSGSLLLALSYGVPAIIPEVGMTREVLGGTQAGRIYDGSQADMERAMREILEQTPEERSEAKAAARQVAEQLTWPSFGQALKSDKVAS